MKNPDTKQHYFLASTRVVFMTPDGEPGVSEHNCVLNQDHRHIGVDGLGKIQQLAQLLFRKRVAPDAQIEVKDVFIIAISYLGLMSEKEFQPAEGKEKPSSMETSISPLLNPGKSNQPGEIDHVSTANNGRDN